MGWLAGAVNAMAVMADQVVQLLPDATDLGLDGNTGWIAGYTLIDRFLPVHEMVAWLVVVAGFYVVVTTWRAGVTLYHLIPKPMMGT